MAIELQCTDRNGRRLAAVTLSSSYLGTEKKRAEIYEKWKDEFRESGGLTPYIFCWARSSVY